MFLTDTELLELTGYQIFAWQARWLEKHRWKFERSRTGRPIVSRAYAEFRLSDGQQEEPARVTLNLDASNLVQAYCPPVAVLPAPFPGK